MSDFNERMKRYLNNSGTNSVADSQYRNVYTDPYEVQKTKKGKSDFTTRMQTYLQNKAYDEQVNEVAQKTQDRRVRAYESQIAPFSNEYIEKAKLYNNVNNITNGVHTNDPINASKVDNIVKQMAKMDNVHNNIYADAFKYAKEIQAAEKKGNPLAEVKYADPSEISANPEKTIPEMQVMNDDEKREYTHLYGVKGEESANEYLESIKPMLDQRYTVLANQRTQDIAAKYPLLGFANAVGKDLRSSIEAPVGMAKDMIQGRGVDPNAMYLTSTRDADASRTGTKAGIKNQFNVDENSFASGAIDFGVDTGVSMVESTLRALTGSSLLGGIQAGLSAGAGAYVDARDNGIDHATALRRGIAQGIAEEFFEKYSLENLLKHSSAATIKEAIVNLLKQGGTEASEEVATEIANTLTDQMILGEQSEFSKQKAELMAQGMPENQADWEANKQILANILMAGLGGFVSGAALGFGGSAIDVISRGTSNVDTDVENASKWTGGKNYRNKTLMALAEQSAKAKAKLDAGEKLNFSDKLAFTAAEQNAAWERQEAFDNLYKQSVSNGNVGEALRNADELLDNDEKATIVYGTSMMNLDNETSETRLNQSQEIIDAVADGNAENIETAIQNATDLSIEEINLAKEVGQEIFEEEKQKNEAKAEKEKAKAQRFQQMVDRANKSIAEQSPERQEYLKSKRQEYADVFDNLEEGDELVDEDGNVYGKISAVKDGIIVYADNSGIIAHITPESMDDDTPILLMETGATFRKNASAKMIKDRAGQFDETVGKIYTSNYTGQDVVDYDENMKKAYFAGKKGESLSSLSNDSDFNTFYNSNKDAIEKMYNAGMREYVDGIKEEENESSGRGQKRNDNLGRYGKAYRNAERYRRVQSERRAEIKNIQPTEISERSGNEVISAGTEKTVRVLSQNWINQHKWAQKIVLDNAAKGIKTILILGNIEVEVKDENGNVVDVFDARGVKSDDGKTVVLSVDQMYFTAEQLNKHEMFHIIKQKNPGIMSDIRAKLKDLSDNQLKKMAEAYATLNQYTLVEDQQRLSKEELELQRKEFFDFIMEEIYADIYADMYIDVIDILQSKEDFETAISESVTESKGGEVKNKGQPKLSKTKLYEIELENGEIADYNVIDDEKGKTKKEKRQQIFGFISASGNGEADKTSIRHENKEISSNQVESKFSKAFDMDGQISFNFDIDGQLKLNFGNTQTASQRKLATQAIKDTIAFYAPKTIADAKANWALANQKAVGADKSKIIQARADILLFAHNKNACEELGITQTELNKKLRSWSNYSAKAREISERINNGVAEGNRWTGIENMAYISRSRVTNEQIDNLVNSVEGDPTGFERNYIARVMLAADTHISYKELDFVFEGRPTDNGQPVGGWYDGKHTIHSKYYSEHTVAHEIGHYLDSKWGADMIGRDTANRYYLTGTLNLDIIRANYGDDGVTFFENFSLFMDKLTDSNDNRDNYYNDRKEVFARFFATFVDWTDRLATGRGSYEARYNADKFTNAQYIEFVKLLQEKAMLDSKKKAERSARFSKASTQDEIHKVAFGSMFSGAGTVDFALRNMIYNQFAVEYDSAIAAVYKDNNGDDIYVGDVRDAMRDGYLSNQKIDYLHASPVCKNFSMQKVDAEEKPIDIETANAVAEAIRKNTPKIITIENVKGYRKSKALQLIKDALDENGYIYDEDVYRASDYGGATKRDRYFLRAVKDATEMPAKPQMKRGKSWYEVTKDLIADLKEMPYKEGSYLKERWDAVKDNVDTSKPVLLLYGTKGEGIAYAEADEYSPTILAHTTEARIAMPDGRFLEVTPRVLARIQGLPDSFNLPKQKTLAAKVVGNGVPVQLTQAVAGSLMKEVEGVSEIRFSKAVSDKDTLNWLNKQEKNGNVITTYKAMEIGEGGKLYPPMATYRKIGKGRNAQYIQANPGTLGVWQEAEEFPEDIITKGTYAGKYPLYKRVWRETKNKYEYSMVPAAYDPYEHSSNLMINDQFKLAYARPNVKVIECIIAKEDLESGYQADQARLAVGEHDWKAGDVMSDIRRQKDLNRSVYLTRYIKPVRVLSDSEVAEAIKGYIEGTDVEIPYQVLNPGVRNELENMGVKVKSDIRFSKATERNPMEELENRVGVTEGAARRYASLLDSSPELREASEKLTRALKATNYSVVKEDVKTIAKEIMDYVGSNAPKSKVTNMLADFYQWIHDQDRLDGAEVTRIANEIADLIVKDSGVTYDMDAVQLYNNFRTDLKQYKIAITPAIIEAFGDKESFAQFRKENRNTIQFATKGTDIDTVYTDLARDYDLDLDVNSGADQMNAILDKLVALEPTPILEGEDYDLKVQEVSNKIYDAYFNARFNAIANVKDARAFVKEYNDAFNAFKQKERERNDAYYQKLKDKNDARFVAYQQRVEERIGEARKYNDKQSAKKTIISDVKALSRWLLHPTDKQHIPNSLRQPLANFLSYIDFSTDWKNQKGEDTKRTLAWRELKDAWANIEKAQNEGESDGYYEIDPDIVVIMEALSSRIQSMQKLDDLTYVELRELRDVIKSMKYTIENANRMIASQNNETIQAVGNGSMADFNGMREYRNWVGFVGDIKNLVQNQMLSADTRFHLFGEWAEKVYKEVREGFNVKVKRTQQAVDYMTQLKEELGITDKEIREWGNEKAQKITITTKGGKELSLRPSYVMSLYELWKRPDSHDHITEGGIVTRTIEKVGKHKEVVKTAPVKLTEEDIKALADKLTETLGSDKWIKFADGITKFFQTTSEWGNKASMLMFGYRKFNDKHYFPIKVDTNSTHTKSDGDVKGDNVAIKDAGFTKETVKNAKNPIIISDIVDVFTDVVNGMSNYEAFLAPMSDLLKWFNYKDENGVALKDAIERAYGKDALRYVKKLISDINGYQNVDSYFANKFIGRAKGAAVGANLSVAIQQPTAYARALAVMDSKYLLKGLSFKKATVGDWADICKYSMIAQWKSWGFYETDIGRSMRSILTDSENLKAVSTKQDFKEWLNTRQMTLAEKGDEIAWMALWKAAEAQVEDTTDLEVGSEEFKIEVAKVFDNIIDRTQVVDSLFSRADVMRNKDSLSRMVTSFMNEPMKAYNSIAWAMFDATTAKDADTKSRAGKMLTSAVVGWLISQTLAAAAKSLISALRDKDKDKKYLDRWSDAFIGDYSEVENFGDAAKEFFGSELISNLNPISYIPFLKDVLSLIQGYDVSRMDVQGITNIIDAGKRWFGGNYSVGSNLIYSLKAVSNLTGIAISNLLRDFDAIITEALYAFDAQAAIYHKERLTGKKIKADTTTYATMALKAYSSGNTSLGDEIVQDMIDAGASDKSIIKAVGAESEKDENGETISGSQKKDFVERILKTSKNSTTAVQAYKTAYPKDTLIDDWIKAGYNGSDYLVHWLKIQDKSQDEVVDYIKRNVKGIDKQKLVWQMADYKLDSSKDGVVTKDGNFNKKMGY